MLHYGDQLTTTGIAIADVDRRFAGVAPIKPDQGLPDTAGPILKASEGRQVEALVGEIPAPRPQYRQRRHDQLAAPLLCLTYDIDVESAQLWTLTPGVHRAHLCAPDDVAGKRQIIPGGEQHGVHRRLDVAAQPIFFLKKKKTQEIALQLALAIVDRDTGIAGE